MKLTKLTAQERWPATAGKAHLYYVANDVGTIVPRRAGNSIYLPGPHEPRHSRHKFYSLNSDKQFVYLQRDFRYENYTVYFGGTDETTVFLTRLVRQAGKILRDKGEQAFYDFLKPDRIKYFEQRFNITALRQGDWMAVGTGRTWLDWQDAIELFLVTDLGPGRVESLNLNQTRHSLTGQFISVGGSRDRWYLVEGVIEAPDHQPLVLSGQVYVVQQAHGLYQPMTAD